MKELKISEEAVLAASEKCPDAKEVLKALFPDVFKGKFPTKKEKTEADEIVKMVDNFRLNQNGNIRAEYIVGRILFEAYPPGKDKRLEGFENDMIKKYHLSFPTSL